MKTIIVAKQGEGCKAQVKIQAIHFGEMQKYCKKLLGIADKWKLYCHHT